MIDTEKRREELSLLTQDELINLILDKETKIDELNWEIKRLNIRIRNIYEI